MSVGQIRIMECWGPLFWPWGPTLAIFYGHFMALFGPKWLYLAIGSLSSPKWVEYWVNMVEHCQTHPGGPVWAIRAPKNVTREPQKRPKTVFFGSKLAIFGCFWHPPVALSRGLNGFNISPWMCPVMFNQVWALFNPFWGIGGNHSKIHCFGRFLEPPGTLQGPPRAPKWVPDTKKGGHISQPS